jgi:hypothetical protein
MGEEFRFKIDSLFVLSTTKFRLCLHLLIKIKLFSLVAINFNNEMPGARGKVIRFAPSLSSR